MASVCNVLCLAVGLNEALTNGRQWGKLIDNRGVPFLHSWLKARK